MTSTVLQERLICHTHASNTQINKRELSAFTSLGGHSYPLEGVISVLRQTVIRASTLNQSRPPPAPTFLWLSTDPPPPLRSNTFLDPSTQISQSSTVLPVCDRRSAKYNAAQVILRYLPPQDNSGPWTHHQDQDVFVTTYSSLNHFSWSIFKLKRKYLRLNRTL